MRCPQEKKLTTQHNSNVNEVISKIMYKTETNKKLHSNLCVLYTQNKNYS